MILTDDERADLYRIAWGSGGESPADGLIDRYTDLVEAAVTMKLSGADSAMYGSSPFVEDTQSGNIISLASRRVH